MKIPVAKPDIGKEEIEAVIETMQSGWVTQGEKVEEFEKGFARYCGVKYGVAVSSGTAALHVALASIGINEGDEVITTPLSCVATSNPLIYLNAKPVFVDVDPETLNIDPQRVEKKITPRTKAILPVHLFGHPVDMNPVMEIAEKHGLYVIEDAAHAHGAKYKGKPVGSFGHVTCFSFYADKNITAAEGGMALTNVEELAEKMRLLRSFGMHRHRKFYHPVMGYNYKMSDIHAAIGLVQLQKLEKYIQKKRENISYLKRQLKGFNIRLPCEQDYAFNVYYVCHILVERMKERVVEYLEQEGVETRPLVAFIPEQPPYKKYGYYTTECPVARDAHKRGFYISNSPLLTREELDYLSTALTESLKKSGR